MLYVISIYIYIYIYVYLAQIYVFILNYICMHMLRPYGSLKLCKEGICVVAYICVLNDKLNDLNEFINVFLIKVLLMVTLTLYDCYD